MHFVLPALLKLTVLFKDPVTCREYSSRPHEDDVVASACQEEFIGNFKKMVFGDATLDENAAGGYLDGLAILLAYAQCSILDPLFYQTFDSNIANVID